MGSGKGCHRGEVPFSCQGTYQRGHVPWSLGESSVFQFSSPVLFFLFRFLCVSFAALITVVGYLLVCYASSCVEQKLDEHRLCLSW